MLTEELLFLIKNTFLCDQICTKGFPHIRFIDFNAKAYYMYTLKVTNIILRSVKFQVFIHVSP